MDSCNVSAKPGSDIWRKPPSAIRFNAPYQTLGRKTLQGFSSAQLTVSFTPSVQYDQAGLLLIFHPPSDLSSPESLDNKKPWVKSGVELYNSVPRLSTVTCPEWSDWSIAPLEKSAVGAGGELTFTIAAQKVTGQSGSSLWLYKVGEDGTREPMREVCWVFALGEDGEVAHGTGGSGWEVEVAAYAASPKEGVRENLAAGFKDIKVEWGA